MHVLTRVTSFSHACQLSPIEETHDSSPSFRRVNLHLGLAAANSIEEASWWSSESPTTAISNKFSFETLDTWKILASEAKELFQETQQILFEDDEEYSDIDMTASWSSAATGKPQLSYAERLRRAKEGTTKTQGLSFVSSPEDSAASTSTLQTSTFYDKAEQVSLQAQASASATKIGSNGSAAFRSEEDSSDITSTSPPPIDKTSPIVESKKKSSTTNASASVTNVWEARRRKLLEQQQKKDPVSELISTTTIASNGIANDQQSPAVSTKTFEENAAGSKSNAWVKKPVIVEKAEQKIQSTSDSSHLNGIHQGPTQVAGIAAVHTQTKSPKANKGDQKRQNDASSSIGRGAKTRPPSLGDEQIWPSPDVAASAKASAEDGKIRVSKTITTATSANSGLEGLDVELLNPSGGVEKQRHGKQWISIVPNITHTSPLPSTSGHSSGSKKKGNKTATSTAASSSSAQKISKKTEQRKSNSSPSSQAKGTREASDRAALTSPHLGEASHRNSPPLQTYTTSPVFTRRLLDDQAAENGRNFNCLGVIAQDDLLDSNGNLSTSPLRSPSSTSRGGSVRGPRFSDDKRVSPNESNVWRGPLVNGHDSLPSPTITSPVSSKDVLAEDMAASISNALHLSKPLSRLSSPLLSQRQAASIGTGSISGASGAPTPASVTSTDSVWYADGRLVQRSRSNAPSPRGHRGRGGSRNKKASDEDAPGDSGSSAKNDNEGRGLPDDVPSGPRQRNQGGQKGESSRGQGAYRGRHINRDEMHYAMLPPPPPLSPHQYSALSGPFYPQYYPVPTSFPAPLLPAAPLEKTPEEFAPSIDSSSTEPSRTLLSQLEFYFSHRNLEGDFYLRKNMDSLGFVSIDLISNFKKVKQIIDSVEVIKETLAFSQVLEMDANRLKVRKAIHWHLYTLLEGERPKINTLYQQSGGAGALLPPPPPAPLHYPNQYSAFPNPSLAFVPQSMANPRSAPLHYHQGQPSFTYGPLPPRYPQSMTFVSQDQSSYPQQANGPSKAKEAEGDVDNDDDEVLGVVAAEGLGGALRM